MRVIVIAMLMLACSLAAPADEATTRKAIAAKYALYDRACVKGMVGLADWCEANLAPEFTVTASGKSMNRRDFISMCRGMGKGMNPDWGGLKSQTVTIDKFKVAQDKAIAEITSRGTMVVKIRGVNGHPPTEKKIGQVQRYREMWVFKGGDWKVQKSDQLSSAMIVDGQTVNTNGKQGGH